MPFKLVGKIESIKRVPLGLYSFDRAFENDRGEIGLPIRGLIEISGPTGCGKTTITLSLAGMLSKLEGTNIGYAFIESFDPVTLSKILNDTGFDGEFHTIAEKSDEATLDELIITMAKKGFMVGIFDSVGAVSPIAEIQGDIGEANMGRRAIALAQFSRKIDHMLLDTPHRVVFMNNHTLQRIGGRGNYTPGGDTKDFMSTVRVKVNRIYNKGKYEEFPDGSYFIVGKVDKNRFGFQDRTFNLAVLGGSGIHFGMTAMLDCINLKIAERGRGDAVSIGDTKFGTFRTIFAEAHKGNNEFFMPFINALQSMKPSIKEDEEEDAESDGD